MFSWFKPKYTAEYKIPTLDVLKFGDLVYEPKEDIAPHEVALLLPLFITMFQYDRTEYITRNKLTRHFKEYEDASKSKS